MKVKILENRVEKNVLDTDQKSMASQFSKDSLNEETTCELNKIVELENKLDRNDLIYKTGNKKNDKTHDFQKFETINLSEEKFTTMIDHQMMHLKDK